MENSSEKNKFEQYRDSQKVDGFNKYPSVEKYAKPSSESDLKNIEISKSFGPNSSISGNDR